MRAAITGMQEVMSHLREHGDTTDIAHRFASWEQRQNLVRRDVFDAMSEKYSDSL